MSILDNYDSYLENPLSLSYENSEIIGDDYGQLVQESSIGSDLIKNGSISTTKISNFTWDKGSGGSLVLGGNNNVNGTFRLRDAQGADRIVMDNSGMRINDGNIEIQDENGNSILDGKGLVSSAAFRFNTVALPATASTTSTSFVNVPGFILNVNLEREVIALIIATITGYNSDVAGFGRQLIRFVVNGVPTGTYNISGYDTPVGIRDQLSTVHYITTLNRGNNTIKVQHRSLNSGTSAVEKGFQSESSRMTYLILGS